MNSKELFEQIKKKRSFLCIGLDSDYHKLPRAILTAEYPIFEFNRRIIDATHDLAVAYKPNLAFYESMGATGFISLEMTVNYIRQKYPELFLIADAKRGDIGHTSKLYASVFFKHMDFDAVTVSPYMGKDSVSPFYEFPGKWVIIIALTSNQGALDFQFLEQKEGGYLYERMIETAKYWGNTDNTMFVVGATKSEMLEGIRELIPDHFLLVPGIGAQGGSLEEVAALGLNRQCGLIVNSSRSIIYADVSDRFARAAREAAGNLREQMGILLKQNKIL